MKGVLLAILGGFFLTLQSVANAYVSNIIGPWQTASMTQFTGFVASVLLVLLVKDRSFSEMKRVPPLYLFGGSLAAFVLFSNMMAVNQLGVTITMALFLLAQFVMALLIDVNGWFDMIKQNIQVSQLVGIVILFSGITLLLT